MPAVTLFRRSALAAAAAAVAFAFAAPLVGDDAPALKLMPGDPAPKPVIQHFLKGDPVKAFEPGKVYVMEFWATWCGPCRAGMPHLSELQAKWKDYGVTIVGVSDEPLETVEGFLAKPEWGEKTQYTVATDPDKSTHDAYMKAAMQRGIPTAFIVGKQGVVEWIGHPMTMDEPLEKIVKDQWDTARSRSEFETRMKNQIEMARLEQKLRDAEQAGDWAAAGAALDAMIGLDAASAPMLDAYRFEMLLVRANQPDQAYSMGRELMKKHWSDAMFLNQVAWLVVDDQGVTRRDLGFAMEAAAQANTLTNGEDAAILDTLARVHWEQGDKAKAIELQKKAVAKAPEGPMAADLKKTLEKYEGK